MNVNSGAATFTTFSQDAMSWRLQAHWKRRRDLQLSGTYICDCPDEDPWLWRPSVHMWLFIQFAHCHSVMFTKKLRYLEFCILFWKYTRKLRTGTIKECLWKVLGCRSGYLCNLMNLPQNKVVVQEMREKGLIRTWLLWFLKIKIFLFAQFFFYKPYITMYRLHSLLISIHVYTLEDDLWYIGYTIS